MRRGAALLPVRDPEDRPEPHRRPHLLHRGPVHGAGPERPADPGAHRDPAGQGEEGLPAVGAGQDTHRHGAAADPGMDGAPPPLPGADQPPAAGGERSGGGHHHPGGGGALPEGDHRPGAPDRQGGVRNRRGPGPGRPVRRTGQAAPAAGAAGGLPLRPDPVPAPGDGRPAPAAGAAQLRPGGRAPLLRAGGQASSVRGTARRWTACAT